jgi:hypothetical protein
VLALPVNPVPTVTLTNGLLTVQRRSQNPARMTKRGKTKMHNLNSLGMLLQ